MYIHTLAICVQFFCVLLLFLLHLVEFICLGQQNDFEVVCLYVTVKKKKNSLDAIGCIFRCLSKEIPSTQSGGGTLIKN